MPIEKNIQDIKRSHRKISKSLKGISVWQREHEAENNKSFNEISVALKTMPTEESITGAIEKSVKVTVNGKIDKIAEHLRQQDIMMQQMSDKIKPLDGVRTWLWEFGKIVIYLGAFCGAVWAILQLVQALHLHFL